VGGTNQGSDLSKLRARAPDILVATPGRLNDNLTNAAVSNALKGTRSLIFDEADRLLDMGFRCAASRASGGSVRQARSAGLPWNAALGNWGAAWWRQRFCGSPVARAWQRPCRDCHRLWRLVRVNPNPKPAVQTKCWPITPRPSPE